MSTFRNMAKSKFVRSVSLQVLSVFIIISIAIVAIVFYSFASEINKNIISERRKQLVVIKDTISKRIDEISSVAYNIGRDPTFHMEPVSDAQYSGYAMSTMLNRYLVGNSFIEHLAYYRLSEPDKIYVSSGERSFREFCSTNLGMDKAASDEYIEQIRQLKRTQVVPYTFGKIGKTYFAYVYPLPQFSANPQAFVLMLISASEVAPLLEAQLVNANGEVAVFDSYGELIYKLSTLDEKLPDELFTGDSEADEESVNIGGREYVVQRQVSESNGWRFVSVIRMGDILSGLANRQLIFILLLLALMFVAIIAVLRGIFRQYKPISNLAVAVTDGAEERAAGEVIDERELLTSTIANLQSDREQKQMFESAYHEADAANKAKSVFLSSVSHDIRTPMHAIIGMTAIARKHANDADTVRDCLEKVQVSSQYLMGIINNVLDMSKIESGQFSLSSEVIELKRLIDGLVTILDQNIKLKRQRLTVTCEGIVNDRVICDGVRLTQVFVNILSNAVKFTPEGGSVSLSATETEPTEDGWGDYVFVFTDTGIGMSDEFIERVFDTFSRAEDAEVTKVEGTGLGMAIAKNLVEMMGGTIRCESELGKGTTFTVTLHLKLADNENGLAGAPIGALYENAAPDLSGRRVLIAEDNAINREIACKLISETGATVTQTSNGREAVDAFADSPEGWYSVIFLDLQMPVMDGCEAARAIRALPRADAMTVPVYAMTASTFDEDVRRSIEAGMNGHIGKPYLPEALYALLDRAVNGASK